MALVSVLALLLGGSLLVEGTGVALGRIQEGRSQQAQQVGAARGEGALGTGP
jgi:hypothetical protein